jgi:hypothetical protein
MFGSGQFGWSTTGVASSCSEGLHVDWWRYLYCTLTDTAAGHDSAFPLGGYNVIVFIRKFKH